jgi:hypothetical protein
MSEGYQRTEPRYQGAVLSTFVQSHAERREETREQRRVCQCQFLRNWGYGVVSSCPQKISTLQESKTQLRLPRNLWANGDNIC